MLSAIVAWLIGEVVGIVAHEAGHVLMALANGYRLREVILGTGPNLVTAKIRGVTLKLNLLPMGGITHAYPDLYLRKRAYLLFGIGGVAANVLLLAAAVLSWHLGALPPGSGYFVAGFSLAQILHLARNLLPKSIFMYGGVQHNDGSMIASILKSKDGDLNKIATEMYLPTLARFTNGKDPHAALSPASQRLMTLHYLFRARTPVDQSVVDDMIAELRRGELSQEEEANTLDLVIWKGIGLSDARLATFLDEWSERAMMLRPDVASIIVARGAVLIRRGLMAEGKALIESCAWPDDGHELQALAKLFLAQAEAGLGNDARADELRTSVAG